MSRVVRPISRHVTRPASDPPPLPLAHLERYHVTQEEMGGDDARRYRQKKTYKLIILLIIYQLIK